MDIPQLRQLCGRPSAIQMRALLDELEAHPHLARGRTRGPDGRRRSENLWRQMSQRLNVLDGCTKSYKQWQKFWADKKSAVKKVVAIRQSEGQSVSTSVFSDIELRIINLLEKAEPELEGDGPSKSRIEDYNDNFSMSDSDELHEENPLVEGPVVSDFVYEVKKEPSSSMNSDRQLSKKLSRRRHKRKLVPIFNRAKLLKKLMQVEEKLTEHNEKASTTLASIAASIKRQEEASQRLTRALLQLVPRIVAEN